MLRRIWAQVGRLVIQIPWRDVLGLAGFVAFVGGIYLLSLPAALMVGGALVVVAALAWAWAEARLGRRS